VKTRNLPPRCPLLRNVTRRGFLAAGCAACAGAGKVVSAAAGTGGGSSKSKVRVRIIYSLHAPVQPRPDWPNVGFDFRPVMEKFNRGLARACPDFEFLTSMAKGPEEARKILEGDKSAGVDGYLVFQMNCWNRVVQTIAASGKAVLYADFLFAGSGGFLVYTAGFIRSGTSNVGFISSSRLEDVAEAVKCFRLVKEGRSPKEFAAAAARVRKERTAQVEPGSSLTDELKCISPGECRQRLKESKILAVGGGWPNIAPAIQSAMGIKVEKVPFSELNDAWKKADKEMVEAIVERWEKTAAKIEGVPRSVLRDSAAMFLAEREVLRKHGANAITVNCLGGFYGGHISAYPCLGFHELNNRGLIGGCECDLRSAATMITVTALTGGRPGMISDPVIDISKRRIIYAHCVASNRPFGPKGPANPFEILTHSEDRQGASVRSLFPLGYMTTTVEFAPERKEILFHQGKAVENDLEDRACRTKLAVEVKGDIEKLFTQWDRWGWHRVTAFGDLEEPISALADALGWKVVREA